MKKFAFRSAVAEKLITEFLRSHVSIFFDKNPSCRNYTQYTRTGYMGYISTLESIIMATANTVYDHIIVVLYCELC